MDGSYVEDALQAALERFQDPDVARVEEDLDTGDDKTLIQLRKACRLLESARTLRDQNGYHTSVIELSLTAVERSIKFYIGFARHSPPTEFHDHEKIFVEAAKQAINLYGDELAEDLRTLWSENRSALYYRDALATGDQAKAAFVLAESVHRWIVDSTSREHECRCSHLPQDPVDDR